MRKPALVHNERLRSAHLLGDVVSPKLDGIRSGLQLRRDDQTSVVQYVSCERDSGCKSNQSDPLDFHPIGVREIVAEGPGRVIADAQGMGAAQRSVDGNSSGCGNRTVDSKPKGSVPHRNIYCSAHRSRTEDNVCGDIGAGPAPGPEFKRADEAGRVNNRQLHLIVRHGTSVSWFSRVTVTESDLVTPQSVSVVEEQRSDEIHVGVGKERKSLCTSKSVSASRRVVVKACRDVDGPSGLRDDVDRIEKLPVLTDTIRFCVNGDNLSRRCLLECTAGIGRAMSRWIDDRPHKAIDCLIMVSSIGT